MSKIGGVTLGGVRSAVRRVKERVVRDVVLDARDGKQWAEDNIPRSIALVVEKWLGFWYVFLTAVVVGWVGWALVETAQRASNVAILTDTAPWVVSHIGTLGLITVLLSGIGILGVAVVSVARVLLWVRDVLGNFWNQHTPRHAELETESDTPPWPPTEEEENRARTKAGKFAGYGSLLFLIITPTLIWLELNYPNQLHAVVSNPKLSTLGDVVNTALWVVNINGLFGTVSPNVSQAWVVYAILLFGLPGIFLAIAARNLLFLSEAYVRTEIDKATEGRILSWTGLKLTGLFVMFSLWAVSILYQVLPGL